MPEGIEIEVAQKNSSTYRIIVGIIMICVGFLCVMNPFRGNGIVWVVITGLLLKGIVELFAWSKTHKVVPTAGILLMDSIISLLIGVIMIYTNATGVTLVLKNSASVNTGEVENLALIGYYIGFMILFAGINRIVQSFQLKSVIKGWGWVLVLGILLTISGFMCLGTPILTLIFVVHFMGIMLIIYGIQSIIMAFIK